MIVRARCIDHVQLLSRFVGRCLVPVTLLLFLWPQTAGAQDRDLPLTSAAHLETPVAATSLADRETAESVRAKLYEQSAFKSVPNVNVGPTVMSGRVADIDVSPFDPTHFYVAYASGGLWRTRNNGQSFEPIFDYEPSMTIGAIAVRWSASGDDDIWVGTGESNSSRSSYAGTGVYRSVDGGETWTSLGLGATQHTGAIALHPENPNVAWVAAVGHLYSSNEERGVYRTEDGGATWTRALYVNDHTGGISLEIDPSNPNVLYAAMWERERRAWNFVESGSGSGIYKSIDAGRTWRKLSTEKSGFPTGEGVGRIGLSVFAGNPAIVYALLDNQDRRPADPDDAGDDSGLTRDDLRSMTRTQFLALEKKDIEDYLSANRFPRKYDYDTVRKMVADRTIEPVALVEFVEDANTRLFETQVVGAELYRSDDGGESWRKTHDEYIDGLYSSYGYYFGVVAVSPLNVDEVFILGVPLLVSRDGGATFKSAGGPSVHADHQAIWLSPNRDGHIIDGNDGGLNMSYDGGETWSKLNSPSVGQFYAIQVDNATPYNVYGGLQDNGVWYGPSTYQASSRWHSNGEYPYKGIGGGDGMQVEVDTRTNDVVYTGSQFGAYSRINTTTGERQSVRPQHELGDRPLRFNWQTPIHLSRHQQDVFYIGANRLYRSLNNGEDLKPISDDLTKGGKPGDVPFGTLSTIDESPLQFGLLYTGSDDGLVYVTKDGGVEWTNISAGLPRDRYVTRVEASNHHAGRVYATLNGYRSDEFASYVFASENNGSTWTRIGLDLPVEPVNVIIEDPENEDLLYVGTDHGLYVSRDRGAHFSGLSASMPRVPVHDLKIHEREGDLLVGTHGRSIYRINLTEVREVAGEVGSKQLHVFALSAPRYSEAWGTRRVAYADYATPEMSVVTFSSRGGSATIKVVGSDDVVLKEWTAPLDHGLNYLSYDLSADSARLRGSYADWSKSDDGQTYLREGSYRLVIQQGSATAESKFELKSGR